MLPAVDDGPADKKEALDMIEASYKDGIRHIVMTSHLNHPLGFSGEGDYDGIFCDFKKIVEERFPDLKIYPGGEVYISRKILSQMDKMDIRSINNTKYVLVEFSRNVKFHEMDMAVHELKLKGYKTVIAHIEQYRSVREKFDDIRQMRADGAIVQCNRDSFKKVSRNSKVVEELMKRGLVDLVASDCHNMEDRSPGLKKTYDAARRKYGREAADRIFLDNPERIIKGQDVVVFLEGKGKRKSGKVSRTRFVAVTAVGIIATAIFMSRVMLSTSDIEVAAEDIENNTENMYVPDMSARGDDSPDYTSDGEAEKAEDSSYDEGNVGTVQAQGNMTDVVQVDNPLKVEDSNPDSGENINEEAIEKTHEELLVEGYVSFLENLEAEYLETCESYYEMLRTAIDMEDETKRDQEIDGILDELGKAESKSDNQVYKVLYDMQNDLEEYQYDVAVVQELREHYLDVKIEVSNQYKAQIEEYGNKNI